MLDFISILSYNKVRLLFLKKIILCQEVEFMSDIIIYPESLRASVIGKEISAKTPTELYVAVMAEILKKYLHIIGQKETHFTKDPARAGISCEITGEVKVPVRENVRSANEVKESVRKTLPVNSLNNAVSDYNENFVYDAEEQKFAFHSEFYYYEDTFFHGNDWRLMAQETAYFNGAVYFQVSGKSDFIFKIYPDGNIKAIRLQDDIYGSINIAVNKNGIFILKDRTFILFNEEGEVKSRLKLKKSLYINAIYIYDNNIYISDSKGKIHLYDIYSSSKKIIWDFSKERTAIGQAVAEDTLRFTGEKIKLKIDIRNTLTIHSLCANDKNIIAGYRFNVEGRYRIYMYEAFIGIDPVTYNWKILQVRNRNDKSARIFTFDMRYNLIWWFREDKNGNRYIYSTEVKCVDDNIRNNTRFSYKIPSCVSLSPYVYFDGKRAYAVSYSADDTSYGGFYFDSINPIGECVQWNPSTSDGVSNDFLVLGNYIETYHYCLSLSGSYNDPILFQLLPDTYEKFRNSERLIVKESDIKAILKD